jgi:hypothetical protein
MIVRKFVLAATLILVASSAFAQGNTRKSSDAAAATGRSGSAEDQAACRPDVRKFCYKLEDDAGDLTFLACLKEHRDKLRKACNDVLVRNGQ